MESAELLRRLKAEIIKEFHQVPDGWKTAQQWAAEWNLRRAQVNKLLSAGVATGLLETKIFRVPCPVRQSYPMPHYRSVTATPSNPASSSKSLPQTPSSE